MARHKTASGPSQRTHQVNPGNATQRWKSHQQPAAADLNANLPPAEAKIAQQLRNIVASIQQSLRFTHLMGMYAPWQSPQRSAHSGCSGRVFTLSQTRMTYFVAPGHLRAFGIDTWSHPILKTQLAHEPEVGRVARLLNGGSPHISAGYFVLLCLVASLRPGALVSCSWVLVIF